MSRQISIVQALEDEKTIIDWITEKHCLLCVPREIDSPIIDPLHLSECSALELFIFPANYATLIKENIIPLLGTSSKYQIDPATVDGMCIEWCRTIQRSPGVYVVGGSAESRFYFRDDKTKESSAEINIIVTSIFKYIRIRYPLITIDSHPRYLAPELCKMLSQNNASLIYPNGKEVKFEDNPRYKRV